MNQITVIVDLTARNLEILKQLCEAAPVELKITPIHEQTEMPALAAEEPHENLAEPIEKPKTYSKTDVKAVCLKFSKAGRQDELKAAFAKFGAKKLTEISEADYPALMEVLGDA